MNSRRDMRMDHHFDYLLRKLYPDRKAYQVHEEAIIANINRDIGRTNAKRFFALISLPHHICVWMVYVCVYMWV